MSDRPRTRYARLEGGFWRHEKVLQVSMAARGLYATMLAYCADNLTDGRVVRQIVPGLCVGSSPEQLLTELLAVGLLAEVEGGYQVHSYEKHQLTRARWNEEKTKARERMRAKRAVKDEACSPDVRPNSARNTDARSGNVSCVSESLTEIKQQDGSPRAREGESSGVRAVFGWASALKAFDDAWSEATGITLGLHSGHQREGERLLGCVERQAKADGIEPTEVVRRLVLGASRDEFCRKARAPLSAALKSFGTLYAAGSGRDPAKAQSPDERPPYGTPEYREWVRKNNAEVLRVMGKAPKEASG